MADAGHIVVISISSDDVSYNEIDGINDIDWGPAADLLDTTDFKDTTGFKTRIQGLKDISVSLSGDFERTDTAQLAIRSGWGSGASRWVKALFDGTNGFKVECKVESYNIKASVDGKTEFSVSLQGTGTITTVP